MAEVFSILFVLVFGFEFKLVECLSKSSYYLVEQSTIINSKTVYHTELKTLSFLACAAYCTESDQCGTASFERTSQMCYMATEYTTHADCREHLFVSNANWQTMSKTLYPEVIDVKHCTPGWTMFGDSCYLFGDTNMTFYSALEYCEGLNATLVHINTTDENLFLKTELMQKPNSPRHWIGLTDEAEEGTWTYLDGVNVPFTYWGTLQPNNGRASNCGAFWASFDYMWVDEPCNCSFQAICEGGAMFTC